MQFTLPMTERRRAIPGSPYLGSLVGGRRRRVRMSVADRPAHGSVDRRGCYRSRHHVRRGPGRSSRPPV